MSAVIVIRLFSQKLFANIRILLENNYICTEVLGMFMNDHAAYIYKKVEKLWWNQQFFVFLQPIFLRMETKE